MRKKKMRALALKRWRTPKIEEVTPGGAATVP